MPRKPPVGSRTRDGYMGRLVASQCGAGVETVEKRTRVCCLERRLVWVCRRTSAERDDRSATSRSEARCKAFIVAGAVVGNRQRNAQAALCGSGVDLRLAFLQCLLRLLTGRLGRAATSEKQPASPAPTRQAPRSILLAIRKFEGSQTVTTTRRFVACPRRAPG